VLCEEVWVRAIAVCNPQNVKALLLGYFTPLPETSGAKVLYLCSMSSKDIYIKRLKTMQETARKIKPSPKSVLDKIVLPALPSNDPKERS
jgi:hypothetical protein